MIFSYYSVAFLKIINRDSTFISKMDPENASASPRWLFFTLALWVKGGDWSQLQADPSAAFRSRKALTVCVRGCCMVLSQHSLTCACACDNPHPKVSFQPHGGPSGSCCVESLEHR